MERVQRKRKKDDERHERKKGKKESSKSSLSAASDSKNAAASKKSTRGTSKEKEIDVVSTTSRNDVDGSGEEEGKNNTDSKDKDSDAGMRQSPEPNCSICLSKLENKSFTDSCFHTFCFVCLLEWSKIKTECPLCKQPFKSIIHNVRSYDDYDQYDVQKQDMPETQERRFRYRTTLTVDRLLALQTPRDMQDSFSRSHMTTRHSSRRIQQQHEQQQEMQRHQHQMQYSRHSFDFRRSVYRNNLQIVTGHNNGRYRNTKPEYLHKNPTAIHRLAPWLERELNVLLRHQESHVPFLMELILDLIKCYPISSEEFYQHILPFVGRNTSHFMREFENFAKSSMPDVRSYDENTKYVPFTQLVDSNTDASSSDDDDDDDVIVLSPRETTTATATATTSGNQSSISVSISLGRPSHQIVMASSTWDKQSSDKVQAESSTPNGQTSTSGWESPQPGPSGILPSSSITETDEPVVESTSAETEPVTESTAKPDTGKKQKNENDCSSDSDASSTNGAGENGAEDDDGSDVVITGYEKPWADRSPILISDLDDGSDDGGEESDQATEKSEEASRQTQSSTSESHRSGEHSMKTSSSRTKDRSHRKSRHDKDMSSSSHIKERRRRERNLRSANTPSFETTVLNKRISSRSRSKSRSGSRSRHSKSKSSGYSSKEKRSRRQRHRDDSPTSSSSSLQLHISQRSIFCPIVNSNVYRVGNHRTLTEHSNSACDYAGYSHNKSRRKRSSPVKNSSRRRSRSSSVEIIGCKHQKKSHKKHKKHKHRKHHRSKHSSKVSSSACGSISDSNFASGGSDVVPISPPSSSMYKKHHSGHKNSHLKQRNPTSPNTDDVHIIATVHGNRSYLDSFQKYANSLRPTSSASASCSHASHKERLFPISPLGFHPSSPIIDPIGADVIIPLEGNDCPIDVVGCDDDGEKSNNASDMLTKTISVPVSTYGTLDEINDPDLKLMIPDLMVMRPSSPSSPSSVKPDCMQANNTSTIMTSASQIGLSSCSLDTSKWLPLSLSSDHPSPPTNPDCCYKVRSPTNFGSYIRQIDQSNQNTSIPSATVTSASATGCKVLPVSESNILDVAHSVFGSTRLSSDSNSSSSSAISVTDHDPITHRMKPFSMSPISPQEPGPSTSMSSFKPLQLKTISDDNVVTTPISGGHWVDTLNLWTRLKQDEEQTASGSSLSDHANLCRSKEPSSTSLLDTLSTICSTTAAKLPDPSDNSDGKKSNLLPLYSNPTETWLPSSSLSTSALSTLAAAATLSSISSTAPTTNRSSEKNVHNSTSTTTNTTTTSEISSSLNSFTATSNTATITSPISPIASTSVLSPESPQQKAREEAICSDNDIQSLISEVFALNSESNNSAPQNEMVRRNPTPLPQKGEQSPNSGSDEARSPTPTRGKLLIDMGDTNSEKKSDDDSLDSDSSSSNQMSFLELEKKPLKHPQLPENAAASAVEAKRQRMTLSPSSPCASENRSQTDGRFEYSSLELSSNKESPLKLTLKRLRAVTDSPPGSPIVSQPSASSSRSGSTSNDNDSELSNQGDNCQTKLSSALEYDQNSSSKECPQNNASGKYASERDEHPNSPERPYTIEKVEADDPALVFKDSARSPSPFQTDPGTNCSFQDDLFDRYSSDESDLLKSKDPEVPNAQPFAAGSAT